MGEECFSRLPRGLRSDSTPWIPIGYRVASRRFWSIFLYKQRLHNPLNYGGIFYLKTIKLDILPSDLKTGQITPKVVLDGGLSFFIYFY
jgi:hypothetical protein